MKNHSEKKVHESSSSHRAQDLAKDLKRDLKESESEIEKNIKESKESGIGTTIFVLIILAILIVIVGFIIRTNLETAIQDNNLTEALVQLDTNHVVDINRLGFIPAIIEINKGDTIIWKNQNFSSHRVVFEKGDMNGFDINKAGEYKITFDKPGEYEYHSVTQIYMKGKIKVKS